MQIPQQKNVPQNMPNSPFDSVLVSEHFQFYEDLSKIAFWIQFEAYIQFIHSNYFKQAKGQGHANSGMNHSKKKKLLPTTVPNLARKRFK